MGYVVRLPGLGMQTDRATLIDWKVTPGDPVEEGMIIAEFETEKAIGDIEAREDGVLRRVYVVAGDEAEPSDPLAIVAGPDEDISDLESDVDTTPIPDDEIAGVSVDDSGLDEPKSDGDVDGNRPTTDVDGDQPARPETSGADADATSTGRTIANPSTRRLARELGVDIDAIDGSDAGGRISKADVRAAATNVGSGGPGATTCGKSRTDVTAGDRPACDIGDGSVGDTVAGDGPAGAIIVAGSELRVSPRARRRAVDLGVDPTGLDGSGPKGAVLEVDVEAAADSDGEGVDRATGPARRTVLKERTLSAMRRTISDRLGESYREAVHVTVHREVDAEALFAATDAADAALEPDVSLTDLLLLALSATLDAHPAFNATFEDGTYRVYEEQNVGLAVDIEHGLITPVLADLGGRSLPDLARERRRLTQRALSGEYTMADLQGGTFTISNLGPMGVEAFDPVINPPEIAILGVDAVVDRVVEGDAGFESRRFLPLDLSFDHRVVDGADAGRFLDSLASHIENPWSLLLGAVSGGGPDESGRH